MRLERVREIADKALAINPNSPEGHTALSWCRFLERDWRGAEEAIRKAIKLNSDFALAHDIYCFYLSMQ
jgi:tetratricopeptide (TPR) repeat protein